MTRVMLTACMLLFSSIGNAQERPPPRVTFSIPAQPVQDALNEFARQTGLQVMVVSDVARDVTAPAVEGELTAEAALTKLLANSALRFEFVNPNAVAIRSAHDTASVGKSPWQKFRLAQAETAEPSVQRELTQSLANSAESPQKQKSSSELASSEGLKANLEEIIVTAQKRKERLQDVPISISVLSGEDLDNSTAEGLTEALNRVPGVATNVYQSAGAQVSIRGVAANSPVFGGSSPVSYYLDSMPFGLIKSAVAPDSSAYDLEQVEVLRGPQGTLYGAGGMGGVVRVLTKDANLDDFQFKARTSASATQYGSENYRGDMAINVPIVDGKLAARAVVGYQDLSGWISRLNKKDANDAELTNVRFKINGQPNDQLSIGLSTWISRGDYDGLSNGDENRIRTSTLPEPAVVDYDAHALKIGIDLPGASITSTTGYLDFQSGGPSDGFAYGLPNITADTFLYSRVFSQEIILNSERSGSWRWSLGGIYRDATDRLVQASPFFGIDWHDNSESYAMFGELSRKFHNDKLEWTLGLRYFQDDVLSKQNALDLGQTGVPLFRESDKFDSTTPRAVLTWHPNGALTLYGSYSEGFRSGAPQYPNILRALPDFPSVKPDKLKNYEIGAKADLIDERVLLDTAIYFIDWADVQQSLLVPFPGAPNGVTAMVNGSSASGMGVDFGVTAKPVTGLQLGMTFSWNDLAMDRDVISGGGVLFSKGDRLNLSPEYTVAASSNYTFPIGGGGFEGRFSASVNYTSEQEWRALPAGLPPYVAPGDSMLIARASLALQSPAHWVATLFIDNLSNEQGAPLRVAFMGMPWPHEDQRIRPRTIGAQLEYRW